MCFYLLLSNNDVQIYTFKPHLSIQYSVCQSGTQSRSVPYANRRRENQNVMLYLKVSSWPLRCLLSVRKDTVFAKLIFPDGHERYPGLPQLTLAPLRRGAPRRCVEMFDINAGFFLCEHFIIPDWKLTSVRSRKYLWGRSLLLYDRYKIELTSPLMPAIWTFTWLTH